MKRRTCKLSLIFKKALHNNPRFIKSKLSSIQNHLLKLIHFIVKAKLRERPLVRAASRDEWFLFVRVPYLHKVCQRDFMTMGKTSGCQSVRHLT